RALVRAPCCGWSPTACSSFDIPECWPARELMAAPDNRSRFTGNKKAGPPTGLPFCLPQISVVRQPTVPVPELQTSIGPNEIVPPENEYCYLPVPPSAFQDERPSQHRRSGPTRHLVTTMSAPTVFPLRSAQVPSSAVARVRPRNSRNRPASDVARIR